MTELASVSSGIRFDRAAHEQRCNVEQRGVERDASMQISAGKILEDTTDVSGLSEHEERRNVEFLALYHEAEPALSRFARAMTREREAARDLVAETLMVALEKFHTLNNKQAFLSFLLTIASRLHKKKLLRLRFWGDYNETAALAKADTGTQPDVSADVRALYDALARLPREQREAVILFEITGLSLEEIQAIQGGSLSGVKSRLVRGRRKLAEILGVEDHQ